MDRNDPPHLQPVPGPEIEDGVLARAPAPEPERSTGITPPSRRGGSGRFLTDVIVELGFADARAGGGRGRVGPHGRSDPRDGAARATGAITQDQLARAIAERYGLDHLDLNVFQVDMGAANLISSSAARRYDAVPVSFVDERTLLVAMADPANVLAVDDIAIMTGLEVRPAVASREDIAALVARLNRLDDAVQEARRGGRRTAPAEVVDLRESADDAPVIKLVHSIIAQAVELRRLGHPLRARGRRDARALPRRRRAGHDDHGPAAHGPAASSRASRSWPTSTSPSAACRRTAASGSTIEGRHVDVRVVTLPTVHGESIVLRILDKDAVIMDLDELGMQEHERERFERSFHKSYGAVLVTGPTGSGKSTTLYAALDAAQHAGEEHHHDRGPGRVPARRASPRCRSTRGPA